MLAEAITKLESLVRGATKIEILDCPKIPNEVFLRKGDDVERIKIDPPLRVANLRSVADMTRFLSDTSLAPSPELYVGPTAVEAFANRDDRRERVVLRIDRTDAFQALAGLVANPSLSVKDAINLLRFRLVGPHAPDLIRALRTVDFSRKSAGKVETQHGRESLGRSVEATVQGIEDIPESFRVHVQSFSTPGLRAITSDVLVVVNLLPEAERIEFRPNVDELNAAIANSLEDCRAVFEKELPDVPTFVGTV